MKSIFKLRKLFVYLALLICAMGIGNKKSYAASGKFVAAQIYADYVGATSTDLRYRVYLVLYQQCSGGSSSTASFNTTEAICWFSGTYPGLGFTGRNIKMYDSGFVDAYCSATSALNSCHSATSTNPGYRYVVYSDTLSFPLVAPDWKIQWNPLSTDLYPSTVTSLAAVKPVGPVWVQIDDTKINGSSPRFTAKPNFYFCPNVRDYYPTNPVDPDHFPINTYVDNTYYNGGSCNAYTNLTIWYSTATSYGISTPFGPMADPWTVNSTTGVGTVTPTISGNFIFATSAVATDPVSSSNYTATSWTIVNVGSSNCGPTPPFIDSIPQNVTGGTLDTTGGINKISICAGQQLQFYVSANKTTSTVHMSYNKTATPTATVTIKNDIALDTLFYSWTPSGTDVGDHIVTFWADDSTCTGTQTVLGRTLMTVLIHVNYSVVAWTNNAWCPAINPGDKNSFPDTLHVSGPPGAVFTWYDSALVTTISCITCTTPTCTPLADGTGYVVSSSIVTGCKDSDTVIVHKFIPEVFDAGAPITVCLNQSATLNPSFKSAADVFYWAPSVAWYPGTTLVTPTTAAAIFTPMGGVPPYTDSIFLYVTDPQRCNYKDTALVNVAGVAPILTVFAAPDSVCPQGSSQLKVIITGVGGINCGTTSTKTPPDAAAKLQQLIPMGTVATSSLSAPASYPGDPNIFEDYYEGGQRQQILYRASELIQAGINPGYISAIYFNFASYPINASNDSFMNFTMRMGCIKDSVMHLNPGITGSYLYACFQPTPLTVVFGGPNINIQPSKAGATADGWYKIPFAKSFYWDGVSNLIVDMCYAKNNPSTIQNDPMYLQPTTYLSSVYSSDDYLIATGSPPYSGCGISCGGSAQYYVFASSSRPLTAFDVWVDSGLFVYTWSPSTFLNCTTCPNPQVNGITKKTTYTVKAWAIASPGCANTANVSVAVDTTNNVIAIPENIVMCRPGYQQLSALGKGPGPYANLPCGTSGTVICSSTTSVAPGLKLNPPSDFTGSPFYEYSCKDQFIIRNSELLSQGMHSGTLMQATIYVYPYGGYTYPGNVSNFELKVGCTPKKQFDKLTDTVSAAQMTTVYANPSITLATGALVMPFSIPYNWDTSQNLVFQICWGYSICYDWLVSESNTTFASCLNYVYGYPNGVCAGSTNSYDYAGTMYRRPFILLDYCPAPTLSYFSYTWKPGTYLSDSTLQSPTAYVNNPGKVTTYTVYTAGRNNCLVHDSVNIYQPKHSYVLLPRDTAFCEGGSAKLTVKGASATTTYQWFENGYQTPTTLSCTTCANPIAMPHNTGSTVVDTFTYQLVVTDSVGCNDTVSSRIEVKPIPVVRTLTHDTMINYNGSVQLFATGASVYTWYPTGSLSNPNIVNPIASPKETTVYTVRGLSSNGCAATDTEHVDINYHGKIFVPSAFTPNGDGRNDLFKVVNLTFEKVLEFHVFNRWGQELFYATDNEGWDGTWKQAPQDIGTYQYLIRVASPDGTIQTFKGDVTLLR